jgi:hypothetical protein
MEKNIPDSLTDEFLQEALVPRKQLVPTWIKVFAWIFLVTGLLLPVLFVISVITHSFTASLYGLETQTAFSLTAIAILVLFSFKMMVAFGLLKQKDWAIKTGIVDAVAGIVICVAVMIHGTVQFNTVVFRLELVALIPYLVKLIKIKSDWEMSAAL